MEQPAISYAINYVQQALSSDALQPPDATFTDGRVDELMTSLYEAHQAGGINAVRRVWHALRKHYPHLDKPKMLWEFHELKHWKPLDYALTASEDGKAPNYAIYAQGLNLIYGRPGSGKSFVAIDFAARLALANPDATIVYAAGEGKSGLYGRLLAWESHHKAQISNLYLWSEAINFANADAVAEFNYDLKALNLRPTFIIVDTLARAMLGINENDTREVGQFIDAVERYMKQNECGILFVHHLNKMGMMRGSTVLDGAMDSMLKIDRQEHQIVIYNQLDKGGKNKHRDEVKPIYMQLLPVAIQDRETDEAVLIMSENVIDDPKETGLTDKQNVIMEALLMHEDGLNAMGVVNITEISRPTVFRNLKKLIDAGFVVAKMERYSITESGKKVMKS